ncbi:Uncharacterised protein [Anaerotruncus sp. 2789STDY5834896]|uniref:Homeodomain phBC6A51-type domain-containing protein n=1 Tax=uncultured Anaerotruncus sp. TaxID=905011 RepID=A0A1C6G1E6_9FIRM|nr:Uncharacterised protein [uncultured Anaerotruncus sp.]
MAKQDKSGLSPKQRQAAEMLANPDFTGTVTDLCKTIDISRTTFYRWMDRQAFRGYLNELIDKFTDSELSSIWKALVRKCCGGDTQAIRLFFELKGKYGKPVEQENDGLVDALAGAAADDWGE